MSDLLLWLALPLALVPILARRNRIGGAAGQLIIAGLGLGAFHQGEGTLNPVELREIAGQSPHAAWFIGINIGLLVTGACLFPDLRNWRKGLAALPLVAGLLPILPTGGVMPILAGALVGLIPTAIGLFRGRTTRTAGAARTDPRVDAVSSRRTADVGASLLLGVTTAVVAWVGPLVVALTGAALLSWHQWLRHARRTRAGLLPLLPVAGTFLIVAWLWLALTIAGSPWVTAHRFAADAPVSMAGGLALGAIALGWGVALAGPWPIDRRSESLVQLPVAAVVLYVVANAVPDGVAHWRPALDLLMVTAAMLGAVMSRWDGAAAALVLLAVTRPGTASLAAGAGMALVPAARLVAGFAPVKGAAIGSAIAVLVAVMLRDQVVLGVILGLGLPSVANRYDRIVATV